MSCTLPFVAFPVCVFFSKFWVCLSLLWVSASLFVNTASYVCQRITFGHTINLDNVRWGRKKTYNYDNNSQDENHESISREKQKTSKYTSYLLILLLTDPPAHPQTFNGWNLKTMVSKFGENLLFQGLVLGRTPSAPTPKPAQSASPPPAACTIGMGDI